MVLDMNLDEKNFHSQSKREEKIWGGGVLILLLMFYS